MSYMNETQRGMMHSQAKSRFAKTGRVIGAGAMKVGKFLFSKDQAPSRPVRRYE